jgi:integrase
MSESYKPPKGFYVRGDILWFGYKNPKKPADGWRYTSSGCRVGQEKEALRVRRDFLDALEAKETYAAKPGGPVTVASFARPWLDERVERKIANTKNERIWLERYILPAFGDRRIDEVRPREVRDWVKALRKMPAHTGGKRARVRPGRVLAPRSVRSIFATLVQVYRHAVAEHLVESSPCVLLPGELPRKKDRDPEFRRGAIFARGEVEQLISDPRIPLDRRVWYALNFLAGARTSEAAAFRWSDYEPEVQPLGRLNLTRAWSRVWKDYKETKTDAPRLIPVHPVLSSVLAEWKLSGWREFRWRAAVKRDPKPDDLIIPTREGNPRTAATLEQIHGDLEMLGLRKRRMYDSRRTFQSLCLADGARKDVLKWVTHGKSEDIQDEYTTLPWETLCEAVACLRIRRGAPGAEVVALHAAAATGGLPTAPSTPTPAPSYSASYNPNSGKSETNSPAIAAPSASSKMGPAGFEPAPKTSVQRLNECESAGSTSETFEADWNGSSGLGGMPGFERRKRSKAERPLPRRLAEAVDFLRAQLAEGPAPAADLMAEANRRGIVRHTLHRAKAELALLTGKRRGDRTGAWLWWLPGTPAEVVGRALAPK